MNKKTRKSHHIAHKFNACVNIDSGGRGSSMPKARWKIGYRVISWEPHSFCDTLNTRHNLCQTDNTLCVDLYFQTSETDVSDFMCILYCTSVYYRNTPEARCWSSLNSYIFRTGEDAMSWTFWVRISLYLTYLRIREGLLRQMQAFHLVDTRTTTQPAKTSLKIG